MIGFDVYEWFDPERGRTYRSKAGTHARAPTALQSAADAHPLRYLVLEAARVAGDIRPVRSIFLAHGAQSMIRLKPEHFAAVEAELKALIASRLAHRAEAKRDS